jgi:hypothetical protein
MFEIGSTNPTNVTLQEAMEDVVVAEDGVASNPVKK